MKLMYSIIIVIVAIAAVIFLLKKTPAPQAPADTTSQTSATVDSNQTQTMTQPTDSAELSMTVTKAGTGAEAKNGDTLSVHYSGFLADGTKFDSSLDRGAPFEFTLGAGMVIPGWDIGLSGMKVGESRKLVIPSKYAYGDKGFPGVIPPNATLTFNVELLAITGAKAE